MIIYHTACRREGTVRARAFSCASSYGVSLLESRPDVIGQTKRNVMKNYKTIQLYPLQWESMQENRYHPLALSDKNHFFFKIIIANYIHLV